MERNEKIGENYNFYGASFRNCRAHNWYLSGVDVVVLNPKGIIASHQKELIITATCLMLIVVIPVFILTLFLPWKYRKSNETAKYSPDWDYHFWLNVSGGGVPFVIVIALAIITWTSSIRLDPYKPLENGKNRFRSRLSRSIGNGSLFIPSRGLRRSILFSFQSKLQLPLKSRPTLR